MGLDILDYIEGFSLNVRSMRDHAIDEVQRDQLSLALTYLEALARAFKAQDDMFCIEPWHPVHDTPPLSMPGEMLLRLNDERGEAMPPYPGVMAFYENGFQAQLDTVLFLCALWQFKRSDEKQVSINISGRSLLDGDFIKTALDAIKDLALPEDEKIIIEIHESDSSLNMRLEVLQLFRSYGALFAIDDVGLSMNDVLRLSEFEKIADFIKLDRKSVCAHPEQPNSLDQVVSFIHSILPDAILVAEGVKSAEHAAQILEHHSAIVYVQGLYLPSRDIFAAHWGDQKQRLAS